MVHFLLCPESSFLSQQVLLAHSVFWVAQFRELVSGTTLASGVFPARHFYLLIELCESQPEAELCVQFAQAYSPARQVGVAGAFMC